MQEHAERTERIRLCFSETEVKRTQRAERIEQKKLNYSAVPTVKLTFCEGLSGEKLASLRLGKGSFHSVFCWNDQILYTATLEFQETVLASEISGTLQLRSEGFYFCTLGSGTRRNLEFGIRNSVNSGYSEIPKAEPS